jgi:hypothetical protein
MFNSHTATKAKVDGIRSSLDFLAAVEPYWISSFSQMIREDV